MTTINCLLNVSRSLRHARVFVIFPFALAFLMQAAFGQNNPPPEKKPIPEKKRLCIGPIVALKSAAQKASKAGQGDTLQQSLETLDTTLIDQANAVQTSQNVWRPFLMTDSYSSRDAFSSLLSVSRADAVVLRDWAGGTEPFPAVARAALCLDFMVFDMVVHLFTHTEILRKSFTFFSHLRFRQYHQRFGAGNIFEDVRNSRQMGQRLATVFETGRGRGKRFSFQVAASTLHSIGCRFWQKR